MNICTKLFCAKAVVTLTLLTVIVPVSLCRAGDQIQAAALDQLVAAADKSHSDALVVWQDGKPVGEWHFNKPVAPLEAMSATKSVVNLAIGKLITDGKIKSLDQPVWEFYPEWKQGRKKDITIRHLLNQTSGLQNFPRTDVEIYPSPDFIQLALSAEVDNDPGTVFTYNNKAVNLLAGIVQKASGQRMDLYLRDEIFTPLGITNFTWSLDTAGNPRAMSGLQILPTDLAKLGQLALDHGKWDGRQLIDASWFDHSMNPGQPYRPGCGLLWSMIFDQVTYVVNADQLNDLEDKASHLTSLPSDFVAKGRKLKGSYKDADAYNQALTKAFGRNWDDNALLLDLAKQRPGKVTAWYTDGYRGQYLVIIPSANLVAVRMVEGGSDYNPKTDSFGDFRQMVLKLVSTDNLVASKR
jgi:CubicO group peptidase (beta-lactamase class C family)